jgi:hypothetical protein
MVLENLLEIISEINRSEISIANRKKAQPLSLIELEYHSDDRMQFNGFFSITEYQQHLMNAHESFKHLLKELEDYEFTHTFEIMRVLKLKIDELEALFDPAQEELRFVPVVMSRSVRMFSKDDYLERVKKKRAYSLR